MSEDSSDRLAAVSGRDALVEQLRGLETMVAAARTAGEPVPAEAEALLAGLRELCAALDGLVREME